MFGIVTASFVLLVAVVASFIVLGVRASAARAGLDEHERRRLWHRVTMAIVAWLAFTATLSASGVLSRFESRPPPMMIMLAATLVTFGAASSSATARRLIAAAPKHWPIAIQTMRIPIEIGLWSLFLLGKLPVQMTFEGRNFDVLVGLTAPIASFGVARGFIGTRGAVVWNVASLGMLANILGVALTSMPGPLHLDWPGGANVIVATPPFVWIPTFFVPIALFGHVVSLRQLLARRSDSRVIFAQ